MQDLILGLARNRIAHASRPGHDLRLLPASRGRSAALHSGSANRRVSISWPIAPAWSSILRLPRPQQLVEAIRGAGYDAVLPRAGDSGVQLAVTSSPNPPAKAWVTLAAGAVAMLLAMPLGRAKWARSITS